MLQRGLWLMGGIVASMLLACSRPGSSSPVSDGAALARKADAAQNKRVCREPGATPQPEVAARLLSGSLSEKREAIVKFGNSKSPDLVPVLEEAFIQETDRVVLGDIGYYLGEAGGATDDRVLEKVVEMLKAPDDLTKQFGLHLTRSLCNPKILPVLRNLATTSKEINIRNIALWNLIWQGDPEAYPLIRELLRSPIVEDVQVAISGLMAYFESDQFRRMGRVGPTEDPTLIAALHETLKTLPAGAFGRSDIPALLFHLKDPDLFSILKALSESAKPEDRSVAAGKLGLIKNNPEVLPILTRLASDPVPYIRAGAAYSIGELSTSEAAEMVRTLGRDRDPQVRGSAAQVIGKLPYAWVPEELTRLVQDESPDVRANALVGWGSLKGGMPEKLLRKVLRDPAPRVRLGGYSYIDAVEDSSATPVVAELLTGPERMGLDQNTWNILVSALSKQVNPDLEPVFIKLLKDDDLSARRESILWLMKHGRENSLAALQAALNKAAGEERQAITRAIGIIDDRVHPAIILDVPDPEIEEAPVEGSPVGNQ